MAYRETKVYREGFHYVTIPYKANPSAKKRDGIKDKETDEKKKAFEKAKKAQRLRKENKSLQKLWLS